MITNKKWIALLMLVAASAFIITGCESFLGFYDNVTVQITDYSGNNYPKNINFIVDGEENPEISFTTDAGSYVLDGLQGEVTITPVDSAYIVEPGSLAVTPEDAGNVITFKAKQVAPMASLATTDTYSSVQTVELSYDEGYTIYYTLNGNDPVVGNADTYEYDGSIDIYETTTLKAVAVDDNDSSNKSQLFSATYDFTFTLENEIFEYFSDNFHAIVCGDGIEGNGDGIRAVSGALDFTWGGYTAGSGGGALIKLHGGNEQIIFEDNKGNYAGSYVYTIFSTRDDFVPTKAVQNISQVETKVTAGSNWETHEDADIRLLLRDNNGDWYLSTDQITFDNNNNNQTVTIDISDFEWEMVDSAANSYMNDLEGQDSIVSISSTTSGNPDMSLVTGGGIYLQSVTDTTKDFCVDYIKWISDNN